MQLFIVFILGAVVLGAGSMLSPAWHTAQPRIALAAALCLALIVGGAVFYAEAFGWNTLIIDYLLFALMAGVVLGGTLSHAQARAEAKGEVLLDQEQGWPGPYDLAFFAVAAWIILVPLLNLPLPLGTNVQQLGYMTLTARFGESFHTLAPFYPDISVNYAPGFYAFSAYLSQQLNQPIPMIQMAITAMVLYLCVWLAYDLGAEIQDKRLGRALAIAFFLCGGVFVSYVDGHFAELMGLLFTMAFLLYAIRYIRQPAKADLVAGGLMMGAVIYTSLSMSLVLVLGFIPLCIVLWLSPRDEVDTDVQLRARIGLTLGFPLVMLIGISPWLIKNLPHILPIVASPFHPDSALIKPIVIQNLLIIPLAIAGFVIGIRQKENNIRFISMGLLVWLVLTLDFALSGIIGSIIPPLADLTNAPIIARLGLTLPLVWFGGLALLHIWDTRLAGQIQARLRQSAYGLIALVAVLGLLISLSFQPILELARGVFDLPQPASSNADVQAMLWIKNNTEADARVLSLPDYAEWLPVLAERNTIPFRAFAYFEWKEVPVPVLDTDQLNTSDLAGDLPYQYIFIPSELNTQVSPSFKLVFEQDGARVYQISG